MITTADDIGFELTLDDGTVQRVAYGDVTQAHTVFEWGDDTKRTKSTKSKRATSPREPVRR